MIVVGTNPDPYHEARERTVLRLAKIAWEDLRYFTTTNDEEARRLSLEAVVRSLADFAKEVEKHNTSKWMLLWAGETGKHGPFDSATMETTDRMARENHDNSQARIRGVVFPGLRKEWTGMDGGVQSDVLVKAQVLLH